MCICGQLEPSEVQGETLAELMPRESPSIRMDKAKISSPMKACTAGIICTLQNNTPNLLYVLNLLFLFNRNSLDF